MAWTHYRLKFRLISPLFVGFRRSGNLWETRRYVPGKVLWAALTARLTRDRGLGKRLQRMPARGEPAANAEQQHQAPRHRRSNRGPAGGGRVLLSHLTCPCVVSEPMEQSMYCVSAWNTHAWAQRMSGIRLVKHRVRRE